MNENRSIVLSIILKLQVLYKKSNINLFIVSKHEWTRNNVLQLSIKETLFNVVDSNHFSKLEAKFLQQIMIIRGNQQ